MIYHECMLSDMDQTLKIFSCYSFGVLFKTIHNFKMYLYLRPYRDQHQSKLLL